MKSQERDPAQELAYEQQLRRKLAAKLLAIQHHRHASCEFALAEDAWIIAPHPDDEVLGCGGTILRKRHLGAEVCIVFLTDGSGSHGGILPRSELGQRRKDEALKACRALNVSSDRVFFLGFTDGELMNDVQDCATELESLFKQANCSQFFIPHRMEGPSDHRAARIATLAALRERRMWVDLLEYPVWCWYHWPWVSLVPGGSGSRRAARRAKELFWSWRWLSGCRTWVKVSDLVDDKRRALEQHASQMFGLPEAPDRPTLSSLRGGEFIERLLGPYEIFETPHIRGVKDWPRASNE